MRRIVALFILVVAAAPVHGQQSPANRHAVEIERKAVKFQANDPISVVILGGDEEYGKFISAGEDELTFYDIDLKTNVTLSYARIRKIKRGYGGYNTASGRHTDHSHAVIAGVVLGGLLAFLIAELAVSK